MRSLARATALIVGLLLLMSLVVGCDGDNENDKEPTATVPEATDVEDEGTSEAPADDPTEEDDGEVTPEPGGELPFDSFQFLVTIDMGISAPGEEDSSLITGEIQGQYVAPDSHRFEASFGLGGLSSTTKVVIIGNDAWIQEGSGEWVETTRNAPEIQDALDQTSADPDFFQGEDFAEDLASLDSEPDTVEGLQTRKYHISKEDVAKLIKLLGEDFLADAGGLEEFEMTVWLEEDSGALVKADFEATASPDAFGEDTGLGVPEGASVSISMSIETSRHNDPTIEIEPPE